MYILLTIELRVMCIKIEGIKIKQTTLTAELVKISSSVLVHNIDHDHEDIEALQFYFSSKKSGGSDVQDVQPIGNGKAIIVFADPRGMVDCKDNLPRDDEFPRLQYQGLVVM